MKISTLKLPAAACFFALAFGGLVFAGVDAQPWRTGQVVAAGMSGHGPDAGGGNSRARGWDLWWTYCVSEGKQSYSAVSRRSPSQMGIAVQGPVRFYVTRDYMYILNSQGKRQTLRLANSKGCR